ncbi:MAG: ribonuclease catalytic domain-containing protein [Burkholderiales bacterium]
MTNVLYEEQGVFKVGTVFAGQNTSLMVEAQHGKRTKIKSNAALLTFEHPSLNGFMDHAHSIARQLDADFIWQCCAQHEFSFIDIAREYFGHAPSPTEATAMLLRLHGAPMYFYRKGVGRFKAAPPATLKAALAAAEKKRQSALQQAEYTQQLCAFRLPQAFENRIHSLLYRPDKNGVEYRALQQACAQTGLGAAPLLERCGALASAYDYHFNRFLFDYFPDGRGFACVSDAIDEPTGLSVGSAQAFSIDDISTTEIDDAFSVQALENGHWRVGIHIAAPALGFAPGSALDAVAAHRLATVYVPDDKITMLPDAVIERYSLRADAARPCLSMYLEVSPDYAVVAAQSCVERVGINANLAHQSLYDVFDENNVPANSCSRELVVLHGLSKRLEAERGRANGIPANPEYTIVVDKGRVAITERKRGGAIDTIVSELMIQVNTRWGELLAQHQTACVYRTQEGGKARMTLQPVPHQGLGVSQYCWISSPLRRYIDLLNQWQLIAVLGGLPPPFNPHDDALLVRIRDFELAHAAYAEFQRSMERYWCLKYLQQEAMGAVNATLVRDEVVRFDGMPLVTRALGIPIAATGTRMQVEISDIDLFELTLRCRFSALIGQ